MAKRKAQPKRSALARKLKALRETLDVTQAEAAALTGLATRTWIAWENDQSKPGRLAKILLKRTFPDHF